MAIEKMNLAFCKGKIEQLDKLIWDCCVDGQFHVENANQFISESMGFKSFNEENPYKPMMNHIVELANLVGVRLTENKVSEVKLIDEQTEEKIHSFEEKFGKFIKMKNDLEEQKQKCENGISVYTNFIGLDVSMDRIKTCEFINTRFGRLPKESYMKLSLVKEKQKNEKLKTNINKSIVSVKSEERKQILENFRDIDFDELENLEFHTVKFGYFSNEQYEKLQKHMAENEVSFVFIEANNDGERQWGIYITPNIYQTENNILFAKYNFEKTDLFREEKDSRQIVREFKFLMRNTYKDDDFVKVKESTDDPYFMFLPCGEDNTSVWGAYFTPVDKSKEADRLFASLHFELVETPGAAGTPSEIVENLKKDIEIIDGEIEQINTRVYNFWKEHEDECNEIYSMLCVQDEMFEMKKHAVVNDGYFFFIGWVVGKHKKAFSKAIDKIDGVEVEFSTPEENAAVKPPIKLKNLKIARPFEFFIEMYGLPSYNDVDVTSFVAITYTLMFGIMFGDLGQGFILMIIGALMYKLKKMALGKALVPCGVSAMLFGFLYGSVFGYEDMLDPVYRAIGLKGKPISVLESVNTILILAISIGIFLVAVSILINVYACIKRKDIGEAIFSQNGIVGLLFYLSAVNLAVLFMSKKAIIPVSLSKWILIAGAIILLLKEILIKLVDRKPDWKPESIGDYIMQNIFELLEYVLSYASNTVSFLRVGAFVLVHAGMMMVVFNLAGDSKNVFVIILGNALVIALEGLLTGIQAMRLEFYEMFSRFYEGDGREFKGVLLKSKKKKLK